MTLTWAAAHGRALRTANQMHRDARFARNDYIDVFAALDVMGVCCLAKPMRGLAGAYAAPGAGARAPPPPTAPFPGRGPPTPPPRLSPTQALWSI